MVVMAAFQRRWRAGIVALGVGAGLVAGIRAADDPVAGLKKAVAEFDGKRYPSAISALKSVRGMGYLLVKR